MGRESLLDFAIRHELGHAFCNDANEMDAERVARLLEQKKPISCKAKVGANPAVLLAPVLAAQESPVVPFHLVDGWAIVLEGTLGGIPNCKIMIDTGAVPSAINSKFVKQLGLAGSWVVGDVPYVSLHFLGAEHYANK
jgi:hypothetical protein